MCKKKDEFEKVIIKKFNDNKEFISVFVMSYGVVFVITFFVYFLTENPNWMRLLLDGFVPTTIAFCGTVIIQEYTNSKVHISAIIFILILVLSLSYLMYIGSGNQSVATGGTVEYNMLFGFVSILAMLISILLSKLYYPVSKIEKQDNKHNDGNLEG